MDHWLVRTSKNLICGPYSKAEVCRMIQSTKIGFHDEVCQANHFWFYLSESEEVHRQLGMRMPVGNHRKEDETLTESVESADHSGKEPGKELAKELKEEEEEWKELPESEEDEENETIELESSDSSQEPDEEDVEPDMPELADASNESTAVLSNRALRQFRKEKKSKAVPEGGSVMGASVTNTLAGPENMIKLFEPQVQGDTLSRLPEKSSSLEWLIALSLALLVISLTILLICKGFIPWPSGI